MWDIKKDELWYIPLIGYFHLNHVGYKEFLDVGRFWGASPFI